MSEEEDLFEEKLEIPVGESMMLLLLRGDGSYHMLEMVGEASDKQLEFVEDLLILERRSLVLSVVMFIERLWLRIERRVWGLK